LQGCFGNIDGDVVDRSRAYPKTSSWHEYC
jgi:hypothetical protein